MKHFETFEVRLRTLSPVFIGCNKSLNKKEYLFIPQEKRVAIIDFGRLFELLESKGLSGKYCDFMLGDGKDLHAWLRGEKLRDDEIKRLAAYWLSAGDALDSGGTVEIQLFAKDAHGKPYIPGSSLKGALRTAILAKMLLDDKAYSSREADNLMRASQDGRDYDFLWRRAGEIEREKLHVLDLGEGRGADRSNAVYSALRGLQVSDSGPVDPSNMVLCRKMDYLKDGRTRGGRGLNVARECIKPGVEVKFNVSLDHTLLSQAGITRGFILEAVREFAAVQNAQYSKFALPPNEDRTPCPSGLELYLGGGAGYVSKTFTYPLMGQAKGLKLVSGMMDSKYTRHGHKNDERVGVSPHTIKCTSFNKRIYRMGRCELVWQ